MGTRRRGRESADTECSVADCVNKGYARGLCVTHYRRMLRKVKRRTFTEKVLALWDQYDLDADVLGWSVDPGTEEIVFEVWTSQGTTRLSPENFADLARVLQSKSTPEEAYEEWMRKAA